MGVGKRLPCSCACSCVLLPSSSPADVAIDQCSSGKWRGRITSMPVKHQLMENPLNEKASVPICARPLGVLGWFPQTPAPEVYPVYFFPKGICEWSSSDVKESPSPHAPNTLPSTSSFQSHLVGSFSIFFISWHKLITKILQHTEKIYFLTI